MVIFRMFPVKQECKTKPSGDLCSFCRLRWKFQYSSRTTTITACLKCNQVRIKEAFHFVCGPCSVILNCCPICLQVFQRRISLASDQHLGLLSQDIKQVYERMSPRKQETFKHMIEIRKCSVPNETPQQMCAYLIHVIIRLAMYNIREKFSQ